MPYLYKLYHVIEFDIYVYIHKYILPLPSRHLNDKADGHNRLFRSGHSMNIYQRKWIFFSCLFSTDTEHFTFLFNEFKLNKLMQEIQYTLYL